MQTKHEMQPYIDKFWEESIVPELEHYIPIQCLSPEFDPEWEEHGHLKRAAEQAYNFVRDKMPHAFVKVCEINNAEGKPRTPLLFVDIPGNSNSAKTVLIYGHLDKQPGMDGWESGLDPWTPVRREDKLYGRGCADDGYAVFAAIAAISALQQFNKQHTRIVLMIECSEESGSPDLPAYVEEYISELEQVDLVVCLDSGAGNYDQLWCTTSLRGLIGGTLKVDVLTQGVHSGTASGIVPDSMRILRSLLSRLEDEATGKVLPSNFQVDIEEHRLEEAKQTAKILGEQVYSELPFATGVRPVTEDVVELLLNRTWRPQLTITGADGIPKTEEAGNVLRQFTAAKLSLRIPPTLSPENAQQFLKTLLTQNPPYDAKVELTGITPAPGWDAPKFEAWLWEAIDDASQDAFQKNALTIGEGGTIPFMGMLHEKLPNAQFVVTGVLGPKSNSHGPNEFLDIKFAKRLTYCVAHIVAMHALHESRRSPSTRAGIALTGDDSARIQKCADTTKLNRWIENILGAKTASDIFS